MCSIFCILDVTNEISSVRDLAIRQSNLLKHRGPDWSGVWNNQNAILAHQRLAIVGIDSGSQPLSDLNQDYVLCANGEIYNHRELSASIPENYPFQTKSDCEVILPLYKKYGAKFLDQLHGMFAFVVYDARQNSYLVARDSIGIVPLYYGKDQSGQLFVSSEMKALTDCCESIWEFPPGHYLSDQMEKPQPFFQRNWFDFQSVKDNETINPESLRKSLEESVKRHLMSDVPFGVLLSGGLDSSIISTITQCYSKKRIEDDERTDAWWPQIHSFSIGLEGSPDLENAAKVAQAIGTIHHGFQYTIQDGLDALEEVIYSIETYDVTTIRASVPMWLLARRIKAMGIKMVLSGEGADEIFGGYLYFHKAPNANEFHDETVRKLKQLHQFDCLRANKSMAAWGVEARVPFLDSEFLDFAMSINPAEKMCGQNKMEKFLLRTAFDQTGIPKDILWRQKEQFSDGVGYNWIDQLKLKAESVVSDQQMKESMARFPYNTPETKEAYYYRQVFEELFPHTDAAKCVPSGKSIACSSPAAIKWDQSFENQADPSGRSVKSVHLKSY